MQLFSQSFKAKDGEQADDKPAELTTLSFAITKKNKEGNKALQAISVQINKEHIGTTINKKDKKKIITIFQLLHPILVATSKKEFQQKYFLFETATLDTTCLFYYCLYALSTGKIPPSTLDVSQFKSTQKKNILVQFFAQSMCASWKKER